MSLPVTLNVRGQATAEVPPDYAWVLVDITADSEDRTSALTRAQHDAARVRTSIEGAPGVRSLELSNVRVSERTQWNDETRRHEQVGWRGSVSGRVEVDVAPAAQIADASVGAGASIRGVSWFLEDDNPAYRAVRKAAVADAFRAAEDFAAALERELGALRTLADPGLLGGRQDFGDASAARGLMGAPPMDGGAPEFELDPQPQTVWAAVEATFEVL